MRATTCCLISVAVMGLAGCEFLSDVLFDRGARFEPPVPPPARATRPVAVAIDGDTALVGMDDLQQCRGNAGSSAAAGNGWTGTLSDCDYPYTYEVVLAAGTPPNFVQLNEVFGPQLPPAEGEVPFRPIAVVTVTDLAGQSYRFESAEGF
ncbi:hypothetical protein C8N43_2898 [Litoreibacter ponti]|uniref:Uncharacterized protein n=1 Tax=Litoreibacter ponti TaxID=1510457 RepID=A0A2T6BDG0_9RHOB|nr:hypothetical protein [Litoreibacter ponti]PTX54093.1 hypothetical protein C8N43_2898 [Litoreibacter ponti]